MGRPKKLDKLDTKLVRVNVELHAKLIALSKTLGTTVAGAIGHLLKA